MGLGMGQSGTRFDGVMLRKNLTNGTADCQVMSVMSMQTLNRHPMADSADSAIGKDVPQISASNPHCPTQTGALNRARREDYSKAGDGIRTHDVQLGKPGPQLPPRSSKGISTTELICNFTVA